MATENDLLSIIETLKEFQTIYVITHTRKINIGVQVSLHR